MEAIIMGNYFLVPANSTSFQSPPLKNSAESSPQGGSTKGIFPFNTSSYYLSSPGNPR